jgi:hypothetical protein
MPFFQIQPLRKAEITQLALLRVDVIQEIGRLHIPVNDPLAVRIG